MKEANHPLAGDAANQTIELCQRMIRNRCVNNGTADSGQEIRNVETLLDFFYGVDLEIERFEPTPGRASFVARLPGLDQAAPSLCLMGHTDVVPVNEAGWSRDPFGGDLVDGEVWGRGAVDMLNITSSMAVAFRKIATSGFRPTGDLLYFAVADEESGSTHGAQWIADNHWESIAADYVLTENGGLHSGTPTHPVVGINVAEKGVAWRRLRIKGTPGHGSMPFRSDNALVKAAAVIQKLADYSPPPRFTELWSERVGTLNIDDETRAIMLDPNAIDQLLADLPPGQNSAFLHACTHTTFSSNVVDGGLMKTNVVPDAVELQVDIRTLPGETEAEVTHHLETALGPLADEIEIQVLMNDPASISRVDTPLWDSLQTAVSKRFTSSRISPQMTVGFTDARVFRSKGSVAYGAGLFSPDLDGADFAQRFHGNDERIDTESLALTTQLWLDVVADLLG